MTTNIVETESTRSVVTENTVTDTVEITSRGPAGPGGNRGNYGSFYDLTDQALVTANVEQRVRIGTTLEKLNVDLVDNKIVFRDRGTYSFTFSIQFTNTENNAVHGAKVWLKYQGVVYPDSASYFAIPGARPSGPGETVATVNFVATATGDDDYVEIFWTADSTNVAITTVDASGDVPNAPGVILTVTQVMYTQQGPQGPVGPQGPEGDVTPEVIAAKEAAEQAALEAQSSATVATTRAAIATAQAGQAHTSATAAATSATAAQTSAGLAGSNANAAALSADNAATSAVDALESENAAGDSAATATAQAGIATTQAAIATTQAASALADAGAASDSADSAAGSASIAASHASDAIVSANSANSSAGAAANSATGAATSASNALTSANNAAASASTATTKASEAAASATAAATSAGQAATSAAEVESNLNEVLDPVFEILSIGTISNGYVRYNTGVYEASAAYRTSDFISINPSDTIYVDVWSQTTAGAAVVYYDASNVYVGYELRGTGTGTAHPNYLLTIPPTAAKMRISGYNVYPPVARRLTGYVAAAYNKVESDARYVQSSRALATERYGIRWQISSSTSACERLGGAVGLTAQKVIGTGAAAGTNDFDSLYPWSHIRRCAVSTMASGAQKVLYEGDAGYAVDGSAGEVMVEIPLCYYDRYQEGGYEYRWVSAVGTSPHPAFVEGGKVLDKIYVSAFEGHIPNHTVPGSMVSRAGVLPTTNLVASDLLTAATGKGVGWTLLDLRTIDLLQNLMWIEHATRNSYNIIGHGVSEMIQPRTDTCRVVQAATSTNSLVTDLAISANNNERFWVGADVIICDTDQTNIIARRKIVSWTTNSPSVGLTTMIVDGAPLNVTTSMFFGGAPQQTGQIDAMTYHTGRLNRAAADTGSSTTIRERLQLNSYRRIENLSGNSWHFLPDVTANDLSIYQSNDMTDYLFGKVTGSYRPIAASSPQVEGNVTATDPIWLTSLINDRLLQKGNPVAATSITGDAGGFESNYFGAGWQFGAGLRYFVHGGGFDHKERANVATLRGIINPTNRWYLYGARLQFKPI